MSLRRLAPNDEDKEKGPDDDHHAIISPEPPLPHRFGVLGPAIDKLLASGVEARGVERVPEDERETKNIWNK
jgi:hypothetical protein